MQTNQTTDLEGNEADKAEQEQTALIGLRMLIQRLSWPEKIAVAQIACNQISSRQPVQLLELHPFGANFGNHLEVASILMAALRTKTLAGIAIEILENPNE